MTSSTFWLDMFSGSVRYYDCAGVRTRAFEAGTGEPLILLHGLTGHAETWVRNVVPLSSDFRVIAVDMVGHGLSAKPPLPYDVRSFVGHVRDFMDTLELDEAHLVGQALGGWVASRLAVDHPERVTSLTLVTAAGIEVTTTRAEILKTNEFVRAATKQALASPTREGVRERLAWLMHDAAAIPEELVEVRYRIFCRPDSQEILPTVVDGVTGEAGLEFMLTPDVFRRIDAPTLVVWTPQSPGTTWEEAKAAADLLPRGEFVLIDGCAHWPQFEDPDTFNDVLRTFLLRAGRGTGVSGAARVR